MKNRAAKLLRIFGVLSVFGVFLYFVKKIKIDTIECRNQKGVCSEEVSGKLNSLAGCGYFSCLAGIKRELGEEPRISKYSYQLKGFSKLEVLVSEQRAIYSLKNESVKWSAEVSEDGRVLELTGESSLPSMKVNEPLPNPGQNVNVKELFGLELMARIDALYDIEEARIEDSSLLISLKDGYELIFPLAGDRDFLLGATVLILNELNKNEEDSKISSGQMKRVDLRFRNPVLKN